jgi:protein-tyrosine phosphatase
VSIKFAIQFAILAAGAAVVSIAIASDPFIRVLFAWIGVAFAIVAAAYASGKPQLLMKRQSGSQSLGAWLVLWPYLLLTRFTFWLYRITRQRSVAYAEAFPGLWFSRRLTRSEAKQSGARWQSVLDLAAEFPRAPVHADAYLSIPMLDGGVPSADQLNAATEWIERQLTQGPVVVHCALGHGRSGCVVLSWLLLHGHVSDVNSGTHRLRMLRAGFGMSQAQSARVTQFVSGRAGA